MNKNINDSRTHNKYDLFLKYFPIVNIIVTVLFMIIIWLCSDDITYDKWNYQNVKIFTEIYEIPLKLLLILLTIWGILIAYKNYTQMKFQFEKEYKISKSNLNIVNYYKILDEYTKDIVYFVSEQKQKRKD